MKKKPKLVNESDLTLDILNEYLYLNYETYEFYRKIDAGGKAKAGTKAGYLSHSGYVVIAINNRDYRAHRLVWFLEHGYFPDKSMVIDHIDRNPSNNRIENLRVIPQKLNAHNIKNAKKQNSLGLLGVRKYRKRYTARIYDLNGKEMQIGTFDTPELASEAYWKVKHEMYPEAVIA